VTWRPRIPAPLRTQRDFTLLWSGQAVSLLGSRLYGIAYLLWVLATTKSLATVGAVGSVTLAAYTAAQLPAGWLADRRDRRHVMMTCDVAAAIAALSVAAAAAAHWFSLPHMLAASVILGGAWAIRQIAESTSIPDLVPADTVTAAVGVTQTRAWVMGVLGPPLGGILFEVWCPLPFLVDGATYLIATGSVALLRTPLRSASGPEGSKWTGLRDGLRRARSVPFIRSTALQAALTAFVVNASGLVVLDTLRHRSSSGTAVGLVFAAPAAAGCIGAALTPLLLSRIRTVRPALLLAPVVGTCGLALLLISNMGMSSAIGYGAIFLFQPLWLTIAESRWLMLVPSEVRGRVRAAVRLTTSAPAVIAFAVTGSAVQDLGNAPTCTLLAALLAVAAVSALITPAPDETRHPRIRWVSPGPGTGWERSAAKQRYRSPSLSTSRSRGHMRWSRW
jgi:MFS family permease